jgi:hypothetical protein
MINSFLTSLFGCNHRRTTFPMTRGRKSAGATATARTYVACLDCGKEFAYDWKSMSVGEAMEILPAAAATTTAAEALYR